MIKLYRSIVAIVATAVIIFLMWFFSDIVAYILTAFVLSILGRPVVDSVEKIHVGRYAVPRWIAATIGLIVLWLVVFSGLYFFVPIITDKMAHFASMDFSALLHSFNEPLVDLQQFVEKFIPEASSRFSIDQLLNEKLGEIFNLDFLNRIFNSITDVVVNFVIAVFSISFIAFFFLKDDSLFSEGVVILFPKRYEDNIRRALSSINTLLIRYFIGIFIESLIKLTVIALCLVLIGIGWEDALLIGLISAVLNVIPYVGPILGGAIGVFIGVSEAAPGLQHILIWQMVIIFLVFQLLDNIILQPYIYSSSVKAHPLEIFLVILIAGSLAGIMGMLLAIPAYTVIRILAKEFFNNFRLVQKLTENM